MSDMRRISELCAQGQMLWRADEHAWLARPERVVAALSQDGFAEYKSEVARSGRHRVPRGGVWQGLNARTGAVASAIWVARPTPDAARVFIDIDGQALEGESGDG